MLSQPEGACTIHRSLHFDFCFISVACLFNQSGLVPKKVQTGQPSVKTARPLDPLAPLTTRGAPPVRSKTVHVNSEQPCHARSHHPSEPRTLLSVPGSKFRGALSLSLEIHEEFQLDGRPLEQRKLICLRDHRCKLSVSVFSWSPSLEGALSMLIQKLARSAR